MRYIEGVMNWCRKAPEKTALIDVAADRAMSYGELDEMTAKESISETEETEDKPVAEPALQSNPTPAEPEHKKPKKPKMGAVNSMI